MTRPFPLVALALGLACSASTPPPSMPTPAQVEEFTMEETEEWLIANLCADTRCRGDRPYRYALTRLNRVEVSDCVMILNRRGDSRPATIPLADVWQVALRSPALDRATIAIRWWADLERDAWYLEDRDNKSETAGWSAEPGSAIFVLPVLGPRASIDGDGLAAVLRHAVALCQR